MRCVIMDDTAANAIRQLSAAIAANSELFYSKYVKLSDEEAALIANARDLAQQKKTLFLEMGIEIKEIPEEEETAFFSLCRRTPFLKETVGQGVVSRSKMEQVLSELDEKQPVEKLLISAIQKARADNKNLVIAD